MKCRVSWKVKQRYESPPSRAAWIEMDFGRIERIIQLSPPSRAAWIEMVYTPVIPCVLDGRRLHGRRGLKSEIERTRFRVTSRRLHGRRGLKSSAISAKVLFALSPPSRAAWIEIPYGDPIFYDGNCRRLHGRRGLK